MPTSRPVVTEGEELGSRIEGIDNSRLGTQNRGRSDLTTGATTRSQTKTKVILRRTARTPQGQSQTLTPSKGSSVMPAIAAEAKARGRIRIAMAVAQVESPRRSTAPVRTGIGGQRGIAMTVAQTAVRGRSVVLAGAGTGGRKESV